MTYVAESALQRNNNNGSKYYPFYRYRENWQNLVDASEDKRLTAGIKRILIRLSRNLDKDAWTALVGSWKLAKQCGTSPGAIKRARKIGVAMGLLHIIRRSNGSGKWDDCHVYILLIPGCSLSFCCCSGDAAS
jgi:hypothetical protein